ncbi:Na(+)-translocating NADH-quinone reductase subunit C [Entomohabitans teleogrylli]|uniref:Na(+)-translocating NADH-quinone reductase subunit C n=1 Tax=Entomohabitans teleogrylli TaxID=1384589 RepID=UPI00073D2167|nr:Na(+)-translocating NADH-quinone reductase subunit C [Entomohabitans teleogrylli]
MAEMKSNDSIGKTLLVVLILCLVCSVVVAGSAVGLKARQQEQKLLDKQRNILDVAGLLQPGMSGEAVRETFNSRITSRLVNLQSGALLDEDPAKFDQGQALKDPQQSIALSSNQDVAGIKRRSNIVEIYLVRDEQQRVQELVLPVYGNGLWSMMYAFVALEPDGRTVKGITYYDQGETPGLGGEIENPNWRKQWVGKKLLDDQGMPALKLVKGGARAGDEYGVDGLSGATLTANGVQHSFDFWMGEMGFGPFLKQVREGVLNNG